MQVFINYSSGCVLNDIFLDYVVATRHNRFTGSSRAVMEVYILNRGFEGSR